MGKTIADRFWSKVDKSDECWVWTGARFRNPRGGLGYGMFLLNRRLVGAHRVAWELTNGPIPPGRWILHSCDNQPCVRPSHLSLGDHRTNMDEMVQRLRYTHGRAHHSSKLTEDQVRAIRHRLGQGEMIADLARAYGVTHAAIYLISTGKNWGWLT